MTPTRRGREKHENRLSLKPLSLVNLSAICPPGPRPHGTSLYPPGSVTNRRAFDGSFSIFWRRR